MRELLDTYRDAVANRCFWENHGRHGDGNLDAAVERENVARAAVLKAARKIQKKKPGFEEFKRILDAPLPTMPKFEKLFARPSVFSDDA